MKKNHATIKQQKKNRPADVIVNSSLTKSENEILFPEKLANAKEQLKGAMLSFQKSNGK